MLREIDPIRPIFTGLRFIRSVRPRILWLAFAAVILIWIYHHRYAPGTTLVFDVRMNGQSAMDSSAYQALLGNKRITSGSVVSIGWHRFSLEMPDAAPLQRTVFIGYGTNDIGRVELTRNRGLLRLGIEPMAKIVQITGPYYQATLTNSFGFTNSIPVGVYKGKAVFDHFDQSFTFRVGSNQSCVCLIQPAVSALNLSSEPEGAQFLLLDMDRANAVMDGKTPAFIGSLAPGRYQARLTHGNYLKETNFVMGRAETNLLNVVFEYGQIAFDSIPADATIYDNDKPIGRTPATIGELSPGHYVFRIDHPGYFPGEFEIDIKGRTNMNLTTNLVNIQYWRAVTNAREAAEASPPDYDLALADLAIALKEMPGDTTAGALKTEYETILRLQNNRSTELRIEDEINARRRHPEEFFNQTVDRRRFADLFDTQTLHFKGKLDRVRAAALGAFAAKPKWEVLLDLKPDTNTCLIEARFQSLTLGQRHIAVVIGQVADDEVALYFKLWEFVLSVDAQGAVAHEITENNLVPAHRDYLKTIDAKAIETRRKQGIEEFKTRLFNALR